MAVGGLFLKSAAFFLRFIQLCCAAIIIGIFSYFLAALHNHGLHIETWIRAVEGISGIAVIYTLCALLLVCCLGGIAFFSLVGMVLDVAFCGAFIYIAYATRGGAGSCNGFVNTPFGSGNTNTDNIVSNTRGGFTILPSFHQACQLETACFAVAIVGAVFFLLAIPVELGLIKHRRHERRYGPSPNNGYTAGRPKRHFWSRKPKGDAEYGDKVNPDALPPHTNLTEVRESYATETTAAEPIVDKYGPEAANRDSALYGSGANSSTAYSHGYGSSVGEHHTGTVTGSGANGYSTTTTTHVPARLQPGYQDGYVGSHQPYAANTTATHADF